MRSVALVVLAASCSRATTDNVWMLFPVFHIQQRQLLPVETRWKARMLSVRGPRLLWCLVNMFMSLVTKSLMIKCRGGEAE